MTLNSLLLIDDDSDCNTLVEFALTCETNWKIWTASNGKEGLKLAQLKRPSAILLDLVMPDLNGFEVYKLLKSKRITRSIPIILVTAMVSMKKIIKSQINEDIEVITKPFDITTLAERIIAICDRSLVASN